jgi:hypothetical protein
VRNQIINDEVSISTIPPKPVRDAADTARNTVQMMAATAVC